MYFELYAKHKVEKILFQARQKLHFPQKVSIYKSRIHKRISMSIVINVEPYDPDKMEECKSPRNREKLQEDKRSSCSILFCIIAVFAVVVGFSVAGYFVFSPINEDKEIPVKTPLN